MKTKNVVLGVFLCVVLTVTIGYEYSWAKSKEKFTPAKIAVVSVRRIFENCKKNSQWQEKMEIERKKVIAEMEKLSSVIKAVKADMETRKRGSEDFLKLMREMMEKDGTLQAKEKFYQQDFALKEQQWTEQLYEEILVAISRVAEQNGLDVVLARDEHQFPSASVNELLLTIKTNKILYHAENMDITNEVLTALDKAQ